MDHERVLTVPQGRFDEALPPLTPLGISNDQKGEGKSPFLETLHVGFSVPDPVVRRNPFQVSIKSDGDDEKTAEQERKKEIEEPEDSSPPKDASPVDTTQTVYPFCHQQ